jgi:hypothetical protein
VTQDRPNPKDSRGRVLRFRPRTSGPYRTRAGVPQRPGGSDPLDLAKYEQGADGDDYRHRMRMNAASLVVLVLLVIAGVWIANTVADVRKQQDCALQGRRNCTPIEVPVPERRR